MVALDASADLAFLFREPGHELAANYIDNGCLSTVNLSEIIGRFVRDGYEAELVVEQIMAVNIEFVPFSNHQAMLAASLLPITRPYGLSLADRACLALALERGIPAVTADAIWQELHLDLEIITIR
jgi:PIN domain nuclease of toxin-antitoxin system